MCQPGKPQPNGENHCMRWASSFFQMAKSSGERFSSVLSTRAPARRELRLWRASSPYPSMRSTLR